MKRIMKILLILSHQMKKGGILRNRTARKGNSGSMKKPKQTQRTPQMVPSLNLLYNT